MVYIRAGSFENTLMLGKIEGRRIRGKQRMKWLDGITDLMNMILNNFQEMVKVRPSCRSWCLKEWYTTDRLNKRMLGKYIVVISLFS